jgi:hypothetical protein
MSGTPMPIDSHSARVRWTIYLLLTVAACTALVIALDGGILVGYENHAGMLPVVRRILDAGYLPGDFGIEIRAHHHRVFAWIVAMLSSSGLGENGALAVLAVASYATLFGALWALGGSLGLSPERRTLLCFAMASGFALINHGVEANRMLGNGPIMPPTLTHAFALLSAAAMVNRRWNAAFAWAGAVALIHLQIGAIWLIVVLITAGVYGVWRRPREWLPGCLAMLALSSPALVDLVALSRQGLAQGIQSLNDVNLRMPQHFNLQGGRLATVAVYLLVLCWLIWRWSRRGDARAERFAPLAVIAVTIMALTLLHYADYYLLHTGVLARVQLLRVSLIIPVLSIACLIAAIPQAPPAGAPRERLVLLSLAALMAAGALANAFFKGESPTLNVVDASKADTPWADVCRWVREAGPVGLYVTPPGQTGFTTFAGRSTVVEFKINPDGGAGLSQWLQRLAAVSGGALPRNSSRSSVAKQLDQAYARLGAEGFAALQRDYGVRTAIIPSGSALAGRVLYQNAGYRVVELPAQATSASRAD